MQLKDVKTLRQVAEETGIFIKTLQKRLDSKSYNLIEGKDFARLGDRQSTILSPIGVRKITEGVGCTYTDIKKYDLEAEDNLVLSWTEERLGDAQKYIVVGEMEKVEPQYYFSEKYEGYVDLSLDPSMAFVFIKGLDDAKDILTNYWLLSKKPIRKFFELITKHETWFLPWSFKEYMEHTYLIEELDCLPKENYYIQYKKTHSAEENKLMAQLLIIEKD
ncbi:hypothetical protein AB8U03_15585 [Clostridium sp. Mt-5]|uniref:Uncharacterized protein n=1 Tax=Clostridium moutaii TaxID=3240932 RepID=A0ABV4BV25_9CLOT